eukprot:COSAG01_NODE_2604_length_7393_cov_11.578146_9_plen_153_part_00
MAATGWTSPTGVWLPVVYSQGTCWECDDDCDGRRSLNYSRRVSHQTGENTRFDIRGLNGSGTSVEAAVENSKLQFQIMLWWPAQGECIPARAARAGRLTQVQFVVVFSSISFKKYCPPPFNCAIILPPLCSPPKHAIMPVMLPPPPLCRNLC